MIRIYVLDVVGTFLGLPAFNLNKFYAFFVSKSVIRVHAIRNHNATFLNPVIVNWMQVFICNSPKFCSFCNRQTISVHSTGNASFFMSFSWDFKYWMAMIAFIWDREECLISFDYSVTRYWISHVLQSSKYLVPPCKRCISMDFAYICAFTYGQALHHTFDIFLPYR